MAYSFTIHIVTFNSANTIMPCIEATLESVLAQKNENIENTELLLTDNASGDETCSKIEKIRNITLHKNSKNLGFSAAHNQGVNRFLASRSEVLIIVNPDVALTNNFLTRLQQVLDENPDIGIFTPKLLRADNSLVPIQPRTFDAAGMYLTSDLRHFDRGSNEIDSGQYDTKEFVFGATGACLILRKEAVQKLIIPRIKDEVLFKVYPELESGSSSRPQLFDEGFFAYREDADLSWRAKKLGIKCLYEPSLVAYHERVVIPERRKDLNPLINSMSVRNRFLLQINNFEFSDGMHTFLKGIIFRNLIVIFGVLLTEKRSLQGLRELIVLIPRAFEIRKYLKNLPSKRM
jgi:GT2 family glycosyltransferase